MQLTFLLLLVDALKNANINIVDFLNVENLQVVLDNLQYSIIKKTKYKTKKLRSVDLNGLIHPLN